MRAASAARCRSAALARQAVEAGAAASWALVTAKVPVIPRVAPATAMAAIRPIRLGRFDTVVVLLLGLVIVGSLPRPRSFGEGWDDHRTDRSDGSRSGVGTQIPCGARPVAPFR